MENNLESVEGMAYDWISKTLYFVDGARHTVELVRVDLKNQVMSCNLALESFPFDSVNPRISLKGRMRKTIINGTGGKVLVKPRGLAVHPLHGYLFYTDWNDKRPHVGRANLDGSGRQELFVSPVVQWPNGLSIDYIANRYLW